MDTGQLGPLTNSAPNQLGPHTRPLTNWASYQQGPEYLLMIINRVLRWTYYESAYFKYRTCIYTYYLYCYYAILLDLIQVIECRQELLIDCTKVQADLSLWLAHILFNFI